MLQITEPDDPPPEESGGGNPLEIKLAALIGALRQAARKTGVDTDVPLGPLLHALILVLEWLGAALAELRKITIDYGKQMLSRSEAERAAHEAAVLRLRTQMEADKTRVLRDLGAAIADNFNREIVRRVRLAAINSGLAAAAVLVISISASVAVGYHWGRAGAEAAIHETESRLQFAFKNGLLGASDWAGLMAWNDITYALEQCRTRPDLAAVKHDRHACNVPLWIEEDQGGPNVVMNDVEARVSEIQREAEERVLAAQLREQAEGAAAPSAKPKAPPDRTKPSR